MDKETRGLVEKALDYMISETDTRNMIGWVSREISVRSPEDLALGYLIGSLTRYAFSVARTGKRSKKFEERMQREIGKERLREIQRDTEERMKDYKPVRVCWTKKDESDTRDILRRRLVDIRRKVSRDFHR